MPVVRTYRTDAPPEEGLISDTFAALAEKTEVKGVHCVADSRDLHVEFTSPAMLVVPKLKGEPPAIHVSCSGRGVGSEFQIVPSLDGAGMGTAIGPVALVTTAVASGVAISRDEWTYGDTEQVVWIPVWPQN
ncbi:hypothetical protein SAMN05444000_106141 [Shimia gijangensis]|uniref:Uncharacterized protein n=2 Tax=Shimia gijangensis TaxID=1470563 RepID=A0A1M6HT38_9RHOB|nr:hypothetical protein SAMN05444000_106141 [Shimia gijangensis]